MAGLKSRQLRILMLPARRNKDTNPYNYLLSTALEEMGCKVDDFSAARALRERYDILHLHWPEHYAENSRLFRAMARSAALLAVIFAVKRRNGQIVWTVHDVESISRRNTLLRAGLMRFVMASINSFIFMNPSSRTQFFHKFPQHRSTRHAVIPHGNYVGFYSDRLSKEAARARLGIQPSGALIGMIGDRKRYKNTETLLRLAGRSRQSNIRLLFAGATQDDGYAAELDPDIRSAVRDHDAIFIDRRLSDVDVATCIQACDLIALPYRDGSNSGLGLFALSYYRPVVCSDLPVFVDLQNEFGKPWVTVCRGDEDFLAALSGVRPAHQADYDALTARLKELDWCNVAKQTKEFYRATLGKPLTHCSA